MKHKFLIFFNTCGVSGNEQVDLYIRNIHSILNQEFDGFRIVVSSCLNSRQVRDRLFREFGNKVSYNFIDTLVPVNISFNHSVQQAVEKLGAAQAYVYVDSGISFGDDRLVLQKMYDLHVSGPHGMIAGRVDSDSGIFLWYGKGQNPEDESGQEELLKDGHFTVPVGKTLNLHIQTFDHAIYENFSNRIMPDIFASHSTEGTFSFINACLRRKFLLHKDVKVHHFTSMDGGSSGFRPEYARVPGWKHTLACSHKKIEDIIEDPKAKDCGFGYEECQNILMHDASKFDAEGFAVEPEKLKKFLLDNFYLPSDNFRYDLLDHVFIA